MRREIALKRVKDTIRDFKEDESKSKYYTELKKSYKEYESMPIHTKKIDKLYLKHMNDLCEYLDEKRNYKTITFLMVVMLVCTICFASYSTYSYYRIQKEVVPKIMEKAPDVKLEVSYKNLQNFKVQTLNEQLSYKDLKYITLDIKAKGEERNIQYNVYLIPIDYNKDSIQLDAFKINISDDYVISLNEKDLINGKIKVYSGTMNTKEIKSHNLRMWIDEQNEYQALNKKFNFQLYVDGYVL